MTTADTATDLAVLTQPVQLANGFVIPNRLTKAALGEGLPRRDLSPARRSRVRARRDVRDGARLARDWRVMREDGGYFCFPEVDIHIPFTPGTSSLIQSRLTPRQALGSMTTGRRFGGPGAVVGGLADATANEADLLDVAVSMVSGLRDKDTTTLGAIKATMYADAVASLNGEK